MVHMLLGVNLTDLDAIVYVSLGNLEIRVLISMVYLYVIGITLVEMRR